MAVKWSPPWSSNVKVTVQSHGRYGCCGPFLRPLVNAILLAWMIRTISNHKPCLERWRSCVKVKVIEFNQQTGPLISEMQNRIKWNHHRDNWVDRSTGILPSTMWPTGRAFDDILYYDMFTRACSSVCHDPFRTCMSALNCERIVTGPTKPNHYGRYATEYTLKSMFLLVQFSLCIQPVVLRWCMLEKLSSAYRIDCC